MTRLEELKHLQPGWLDGEGQALPPKAVDEFANLFEEFYSTTRPLPHIYPTEEGGLRLEWLIGPLDLS